MVNASGIGCGDARMKERRGSDWKSISSVAARNGLGLCTAQRAWFALSFV